MNRHWLLAEVFSKTGFEEEELLLRQTIGKRIFQVRRLAHVQGMPTAGAQHACWEERRVSYGQIIQGL